MITTPSNTLTLEIGQRRGSPESIGKEYLRYLLD
jgi:hypothetical protein